MAYIDATYYTDTFKGVPVDASDIDRYIERASDMIDMVTRYRITSIDDYHPRMQEFIKKATAAQVEFIENEGGLDDFVSGDYNSVTIGKFSASKGGNSTSNQVRVAPGVIQYLKPTGLLNGAVNVYGSSYSETIAHPYGYL